MYNQRSVYIKNVITQLREKIDDQHDQAIVK